MSKRFQADLALVLSTLVWGATFVVVKAALEDASVFAFMAARFTLAAALMMLIYRGSLRRMSWAEAIAGAQIGFFMFIGYAFQTAGLLRTTPSKAAFITGFSVVLVPVLLAIFLRRRLNGWTGAGALVALAGLYFLTVPPAGLRQLNRGDVLVFFAAVMFAVHIVLVGHYSPRHSVGALSFVQVAATAGLTFLVLPVMDVTHLDAARFHWSGRLIAAVLITAVLATALAFSAQVWAQRFTPASHAAIIFTLEPVFAAITSFLVVGERMGGRALGGAGLVLAGILVSELKGPAPAAAESPEPVGESGEPDR